MVVHLVIFMQVTRVKQALQATSLKAAGDTEALWSEAGGLLNPGLLGGNGANGQPRVRLFRSKMASCKGGHFLVRTTEAKTSKVDYLAYVPFLLDGGHGNAEGGIGAINTVMKISDIFLWQETSADGVVRKTRFLLGEMHELQPVGDPLHGYEVRYTDTSIGERLRKPSLLQKKPLVQGGAGYTYGVRLDQVDCTLVSTRNEQFFVPTLKMSTFG